MLISEHLSWMHLTAVPQSKPTGTAQLEQLRGNDRVQVKCDASTVCQTKSAPLHPQSFLEQTQQQLVRACAPNELLTPHLQDAAQRLHHGALVLCPLCSLESLHTSISQKLAVPMPSFSVTEDTTWWSECTVAS